MDLENNGPWISYQGLGTVWGHKDRDYDSPYLIDISKYCMVPKAGFEPARVSPPPPQDGVSTRFHHFGMVKFIWLVRLALPVQQAFRPGLPVAPEPARFFAPPATCSLSHA